MNIDFIESIRGLKGAKVRFILKDGQFIEGVLVAVKQDHLVVNLEEYNFYVVMEKVSEITINAKHSQIIKQTPQYIDRNSFKDVLHSMKYNYVTINGLSKELFDGLLIAILNDCIVVVKNAEIHFINYSNILNIIDGEYCHLSSQGDVIQELITTAQQNNEQSLETATISIQPKLEQSQDKIVASSFFEETLKDIDTAENLNPIGPKEMNETNLSDTSELINTSEEQTPTSSLVKEISETSNETSGSYETFDSNAVSEEALKFCNTDSQYEEDVEVQHEEMVVVIENQQEESRVNTEVQLEEQIVTTEFLEGDTMYDVSHSSQQNIDSKEDAVDEIECGLVELEDPPINIERQEHTSPVETTINEIIYEDLTGNECKIQSYKEYDNIDVHEEVISDNVISSIYENALTDDCKLNEIRESIDLQTNEVTKIRRKAKSFSNYKLYYYVKPVKKLKQNKKYVINKNTFKGFLQLDCRPKLENKGHTQIYDENQVYALVSPSHLKVLDNQLASDKCTNDDQDELKNDEKMLLEIQYLALMKHAERMLINMYNSQNSIQSKSIEGVILNQYLALFNSAKKMYIQMKSERLSEL